MNVNRVIINGNLTKDPELRSTPSGASVARLRVAVNERMKRNDEWVDRANYFDVTVWGKSAENCNNYLEKGRPVLVEGRLRWEEWEAKDGSGKRQAVKIVADQVIFLGTGKGEKRESTSEEYPDDWGQGGGGGGGEPADEDDDIPF